MAVLKYYNTTTSAWEYIAASTTANFTSWKKTAAGGETSVSGIDDNAVTLSYTVGLEQVFINGVLQVRGSDYTATTGTSVTGLTALVAGDIVTVVCYAPFNIANTIAPTVVDAKGDLIAGTAADTVGRLAVGTNGQMLVADSTASTGLAWATAGKILQVSSISANRFTTTSTSYTDITGTSISITPGSSSNKILIIGSAGLSASSTNTIAVKLLRDSTDLSGIIMSAAVNTASNQVWPGAFVFLDSPATTSSVTYKLQTRTESGSVTTSVGGRQDGSYEGKINMVVMEVKA